MMMKGKRTKRPHPASISSSTTTMITTTEEEDQNMAHCLILLAQGVEGPTKTLKPDSPPVVGPAMYECKTCSRSFQSFQALGGHRASHNKPRFPQPISFAVVHQQENSVEEMNMGLSLEIACAGYNSSTATSTWSASNTKPKVHACSICGAQFSSGQALGGHMRRHRPLPSSSATSPPQQPPTPPRNQLSLDLNLPADQQQQQSPNFTFPSNDKTLVFSTSLVDCHNY